MGCGCPCFRIKENSYYDAFLNMQKNIKFIKETSFTKVEKILVKTKSIESFITIIKESGILSDKKKKGELMEKLKDYELENNIEIISDSQEANNMISTGVDNEFIIVDEKFFEFMNQNINKPKIGIFFDDSNKLKVRFLVSHDEFFITDENNDGFYKFIN